MVRLGKHHYRDAIMVTLSRLHYWQETNHPMATEMLQFLPHFSEVLVDIFFSGTKLNNLITARFPYNFCFYKMFLTLTVLSSHTDTTYSAEQIQDAAIWVDEMKNENNKINETYLVHKLGCYSKNITPTSATKHFGIISKASQFVKSLFNKAIALHPSTLEDSVTYDSAGLLSYQTEIFGELPAHIFPLPCARPSCEVVCSGCQEKLKGDSQRSYIRRKCGHVLHQMCLLPDFSKLRPKLMYKAELKSLCVLLKLDSGGLKDKLLRQVVDHIKLNPGQVLPCPGCEMGQNAPATRRYCHMCLRFITSSCATHRFHCGHLVHSKCAENIAALDKTCPICQNLVEEVIEETSKRAKKCFTKPDSCAHNSTNNNDEDDNDVDDDGDIPKIDPGKEETMSVYYGELAVKAKHNKEQRGSLPRTKIIKIND